MIWVIEGLVVIILCIVIVILIQKAVEGFNL